MDRAGVEGAALLPCDPLGIQALGDPAVADPAPPPVHDLHDHLLLAGVAAEFVAVADVAERGMIVDQASTLLVRQRGRGPLRYQVALKLGEAGMTARMSSGVCFLGTLQGP